MAVVAQHLTVEELEERFRHAGDVVERTHFQTILLLAKGHSRAEVCGIVGLSRRWVTRLSTRYRQAGESALGDQRRRNAGAAPLLGEQGLAALRERLATTPDDGGLWTGPKVARWMEGYLGLVHVHAPRGWEALKRVGWSIQAPRPKNPQSASPEDCQAFKKS